MLLLTACSTPNPYHDPARPHRGPHGFQNNHIRFEPKGLLALLRWRFAAWRDGLPPAPRTPTPRVAPELAFLQANAVAGQTMQPAVTWIGHASVLVQAGGLNVLIDPMFSPRASPFTFVGPQRALPPAMVPGELPRIDAVLVSHNHYDHLDAASIDALAAQPGGPPLFIVPLGLKAWLAGRGIANAVELDWWQGRTLAGAAGPVEIVLTPVQHWSGRSLGDRMQTLWGGYAIFAADAHLFHAGDTGYSPDFRDIRARFAARQDAAHGGGFDLAMLPVGAYAPRWFMREQHVDSAEAVQIHRDLGAKRSLGIHWGIFELTDEPLDEPPQALAAARRAQGVADDAFAVVPVGTTLKLARRAPVP